MQSDKTERIGCTTEYSRLRKVVDQMPLRKETVAEYDALR
jgi:hypothetical protein